MTQGRISFIDLAKGFCISIVMLFHIRGIATQSLFLDPVLFTACMLPPFFFLSGLFFKEDTFGVFLRKKINKLLIPFLAFYLLTAVILPYLLHYFRGMEFESVVGWHSLWAFIWPGKYPNFALWFLWCLFLINIMFWGMLRFAKRFFQNHQFLAISSMILAFAVVGNYAYFSLSADIGNLFGAMRNLPFFCLGYLASQKDFIEKVESASMTNKAICLLLAFIVTLLLYLPIVHQSLIANTLAYYVCGIAGTILILSLSSMIVKLPLISYLGRYSIIVLLTHGLIIRFSLPFVLRLSGSMNPYCLIFAFWLMIALSYLIITPLCKRFLPHITAQKPLLRI